MNVGGGTGDGAPVVGPAPAQTHTNGVESPRSVKPPTAGKATRRPPQTHCISGHPYDTDNTYIDPTGRRRCRECARIRGLKRSRRPPQPATAVHDIIGALADYVAGNNSSYPLAPHRHRPALIQEPCVIHHFEYERWVAQPERQGRHPMWDAMWAEATAHLNPDTAEAAS